MIEKRLPNSGRIEYPIYDEEFSQQKRVLFVELEEKMVLSIEGLNDEEKNKLPLIRESLARKLVLLDLCLIITELKARFHEYTSETVLEIGFFLSHPWHRARLDISPDTGNLRLRVNLSVLEGFARGYKTQFVFEANAQLRYLLAHEFHHFYNLHRFTETMSRSSGIDPFEYPDKYTLNRSEIAAHLFAIKDLRGRPESHPQQRMANFQIADMEESKLNKMLVKARLKMYVKTFPVKIAKLLGKSSVKN